MSDVDDLVAAMIKGDPGETVPLEIVTAMAQAAWNDWWRQDKCHTCPDCEAHLAHAGGHNFWCPTLPQDEEDEADG